YGDLMGELLAFFRERVDYAQRCGIDRRKIVLDPGIGFGKRVQDNFAILRNLDQIVGLGHQVLVGPSRKSFIGATLDLPVQERVEGTAAAVTAAVLNGARMVRVHDVRQMKRVVAIADGVVNEGALA
ncbi:MAG: dihydropteroate synthase, partial [Fidelibacterota bacterium]